MSSDAKSRSFAYPEGETAFLEAADGVWWLYTDSGHTGGLGNMNLWLLEDGDGWFMIDAGMYNEKSVALWERLLAEPPGGRPVKRVLLTHFHPDHVGMASWLAERTGAEFLMAREEYLLAAYLHADIGGLYNRLLRARYEQEGMEASVLAAFPAENGYRKLVSGMPGRFSDLSGMNAVVIGGREWEIIRCSGHSYAHICLYNAETGVLIAGDQALQNKSASLMIPVFEPGFNPLREYFRTCRRLEELPADTLTLPAHGLPYYGLTDQLTQIRSRHEQRLGRIRAAGGEPEHAWDIFRLLHGGKPLQGFRLKFAFENCIADLIYMRQQKSEEKDLAHEPFS